MRCPRGTCNCCARSARWLRALAVRGKEAWVENGSWETKGCARAEGGRALGLLSSWLGRPRGTSKTSRARSSSWDRASAGSTRPSRPRARITEAFFVTKEKGVWRRRALQFKYACRRCAAAALPTTPLPARFSLRACALRARDCNAGRLLSFQRWHLDLRSIKPFNILSTGPLLQVQLRRDTLPRLQDLQRCERSTF